MTNPGYYDQSIPPALLAGRARPAAAVPAGGDLAAAAPTGAGQQPPSPRLLAGPGGYSTPLKASQRPRNLQELTARADPQERAPWPEGASVPIGTSGKRAHWTGTEWRGGESPGYPAPQELPAESQDQKPRGAENLRQEQPQTEESPAESGPGRHAAPLPPPPYRTQFPGDEQPGDLTR